MSAVSQLDVSSLANANPSEGLTAMCLTSEACGRTASADGRRYVHGGGLVSCRDARQCPRRQAVLAEVFQGPCRSDFGLLECLCSVTVGSSGFEDVGLAFSGLTPSCDAPNSLFLCVRVRGSIPQEQHVCAL